MILPKYVLHCWYCAKKQQQQQLLIFLNMLTMLTLTQVFLTHLVGVFLKQSYPKYISDVASKILEEKKRNYQMFCLNLSSWNWVSCGESWKSLFPIFLIFHRTDFDGFLVCCWIAIQQLNGVEKNYVAIVLMLNQNLAGLIQRKHLV